MTDEPSKSLDEIIAEEELMASLEEWEHTHKSRAPPPTFSDSVISGTAAAIAETVSLHWTTAARFREQLKVSKSTDFRVLYNSLGPDLLSMIPITIAQVFFDSAIRQAMGAGERGLTTRERLVAAAGAGAIASPFPCYAEMLMLIQQKYSMKFLEAIKFHYKSYGFKGLFRGLLVTSLRDSIYTTAYLGFAPWLRDKAEERFSANPQLSRHNSWLPFVIAGPTGGLAAAIVTQPLDCIKSLQQSSHQRLTITQACNHLMKHDGWKGFFLGMSGRVKRVSLGVIVLSLVNDQVQRWLNLEVR